MTAPTVFLVGTETLLNQGFRCAALHLADQVENAHVREVPDVGHFAPVNASDVVAAEVTRFLESVPQPT